MKKVVIFGSGGHAQMCLSIIRKYKDVEVVGFLDADKERHGFNIDGVSVLGDDNDLVDITSKKNIKHFVIGIGSTISEGNRLRCKLYQKALNCSLENISVISKDATIMGNIEIGGGVQIFPGAIINTNVEIGNNVIVNTGVILEHDCIVEDHVHIASGAVVCGGVTIKEGSFVGAGARVKQGVDIKPYSTIAMGSVVIEDTESNIIVAGCPARPLN